MSVVREVPIRDQSIRLGQFLKLSDLVDSGSDAKPPLMQGLVFVELADEIMARPGRREATWWSPAWRRARWPRSWSGAHQRRPWDHTT